MTFKFPRSAYEQKQKQDAIIENIKEDIRKGQPYQKLVMQLIESLELAAISPLQEHIIVDLADTDILVKRTVLEDISQAGYIISRAATEGKFFIKWRGNK